MSRDPIVEDIHKIREKIAKDNDYDLKRILEGIKENEKKHIQRLVDKKDLLKAS